LENNSRKPRDLTENRQSDSLKKGKLALSLGKMKKGNDVTDDDDDDVVRTSVSQDQMTATLCILRNCSSGINIHNSLHILDR
jgi:hypothetical protein